MVNRMSAEEGEDGRGRERMKKKWKIRWVMRKMVEKKRRRRKILWKRRRTYCFFVCCRIFSIEKLLGSPTPGAPSRVPLVQFHHLLLLHRLGFFLLSVFRVSQPRPPAPVHATWQHIRSKTQNVCPSESAPGQRQVNWRRGNSSGRVIWVAGSSRGHGVWPASDENCASRQIIPLQDVWPGW